MKPSISIRSFVFLVVFFMLGLVGISAQDEIVSTVARLQDAEGNIVGSVFFTQSGDKVWVVAQVNDLPAGFHGVQVHAAGACEGDGFSGAGMVLNPTEDAAPNQSGNLPAVLVLQDGTGHLTSVTDRFRVNDLMDSDGSAVVIHESTDEGSAGIACGVIQTLTSDSAARANLDALAVLPLDMLPATVSREEGAENGTLVLTLPNLGGVQIVGQIASGAAGQIGTVTQEGDFLVFNFTEITYDVSPIELPGGIRIGAQSIRLDPSVPSTLRTNMTTGEILRDFHWIQTATDVLYDGSDSITLGDTARAQVAEVVDLGDNRYSVRLLTHWRSSIELTTWTVGGVTLPSGTIEATAEFDGIYILDFNK